MVPDCKEVTVDQRCAYCSQTDYYLPFPYNSETGQHETVCAHCLEGFQKTAPGRFVNLAAEPVPPACSIDYDLDAA